MKQQYSGFMRWTSRFMMVCMVSLGVPASAFAGMVDTDKTVDHTLAVQGRAKIMALIDREDIRSQLQAKGVTAEQAKSRVSALTDEEALQISGKLDQLPAGGEILGVLLTIFIVLLITDILGFTKVFPFTRSVKR
ncbi:MAG: PA2779 family protein [Sideroxyarcus sp.]|nr:PA2779 family protein [Sideroxyarcus sp.]